MSAATEAVKTALHEALQRARESNLGRSLLPEHVPGDDEDLWNSGDMWARPDESSDYILGWHRRTCAYADQTIESLDLTLARLRSQLAQGKPDHSQRDDRPRPR